MKSPMNRTGIAFLMLAATAHDGPRVSANYSVPAESLDGGGERATSAAYTNDGNPFFPALRSGHGLLQRPSSAFTGKAISFQPA
ncbi:MAG: hypothetical protein K9N23_18625 [Akkermansiaceae bacterium]|nr:hypothetical protein [Akkermansiaceae bacterium]